MFFDVWFIVDIWLSFNTGVIPNENLKTKFSDADVVMTCPEVRSYYIQNWFLIDFVSTVPFDLIGDMLMRVTSGAVSNDKLRFLTLLKGLKLARISKITKMFDVVRVLLRFNFHYDEMVIMIEIVKQFLTLIIYWIFIGSAQFGICFYSDDENFEISWVRLQGFYLDKITPNPKKSIFDRLLNSVFRSFSQTFCIGYGQIPPRSVLDASVVMVSMLIGAVMFSNILAYITAIFQNSDSAKQDFKSELMKLKEYMQFRRLPTNMKVRLSDYMECKYNRKLFNEEKILGQLNPLLVQKLWENKGRKLLDTVEYLKDCEQEFKMILVTKLKLEIYLQGDVVLEIGDPATGRSENA